MDFLAQLYRNHVWSIAKTKGWHTEGDAMPTYRAWIRAEQMLRLDVLIIEHRNQFATAWEPLLGYKALTHLLFVRTGWSPQEIEKLSFSETLLVLQQDLVNVQIPQGVLIVPDSVRWSLECEVSQQDPCRIEWPPCSEDEWDPTLAEKAQGWRRS
ncbi:ECs1072 family phage-associated protein [Serratia fonticola]|uniref:ECs1072 family phage-associated protein n=1 Tax=Serratia fonticola TaxID=47917 RepID=UPI00192CEE67|nr:hypothetical protein [Serratia fonticola]